MPSIAPAYWISNTPVAGITELAGRLARAFPDTGVWPLLWMYPDDPDVYMPQPSDPDLIDSISVETELARHWAQLSAPGADAADYFGPERPVLADPSAPVAAEQARPFDRLATDARARLLLVPCNRPADAITVIGGLACELAAPDISALIRSWEERFAAILVAAAPSSAWLAVESPPRERDQALALAAELNVGCRLPDAYNDATLPQIATALIADPTAHSPATTASDLRPDLWPLAWWE